MNYYKYIVQITNYMGKEDTNNIKVFNSRRKHPRMRRYKHNQKRQIWLLDKIHYLYLKGYAIPDFTRGICWGIYRERDEDPTLTQAQEWPFK